MRTQLSIVRADIIRQLLTAALGLALTFTFSCSGDDGDEGGGGNFNYGSVTDKGGKTYKTIKIGDQTWMAENLNYDVPGNDTDVCYANDPANCAKYGRLYNWETANTACPNGWHLSSWDEWGTLDGLVGDRNKLKARNGWNENGNGTDDYGFSALPGGKGYSSGEFSSIGDECHWWTSKEDNRIDAWYRDLRLDDPHYGGTSDKGTLRSVRCVQDN